MQHNKSKSTSLDNLKKVKQPLELGLPGYKRPDFARNPSRARAKHVASKRRKPWERPDGTTDWSKATWGHAIGTGINNLPKDINRTIDDMALMFKEWDTTAHAIGTLAGQAIWKPFSLLKPEQMAYNFLRMTTPGALPNVPESVFEDASRKSTQMFDTVIDMYRQNYDFAENGAAVKQFVAENPAQFLEDVATVATLFFGGSGAAAKRCRFSLKINAKAKISAKFQ